MDTLIYSSDFNSNGKTMVASDSIINLGVSMSNFPQLIFSLGGAPEYPPYDDLDSLICANHFQRFTFIPTSCSNIGTTQIAKSPAIPPPTCNIPVGESSSLYPLLYLNSLMYNLKLSQQVYSPMLNLPNQGQILVD